MILTHYRAGIMMRVISWLASYPWQHLVAWVAHARERRHNGCVKSNGRTHTNPVYQLLSLAHFQILPLPVKEAPKRLDRRLFAEPSRAICPSVDALADQVLDVRHINMIWIVSDRG